MSYYPVKRRKPDILFSNFIREKAGWKCQKCGRLCKVDGQWIYKLEASHYYGRANETTRFDPDNVYALCSTCHRRMGGHTREENGEYDLWVKEMLGEHRYNLLRIRANTSGKKDDYLAVLYINTLIKEYYAKRGIQEDKIT